MVADPAKQIKFAWEIVVKAGSKLFRGKFQKNRRLTSFIVLVVLVLGVAGLAKQI